jgi:hypothetical protein
MNYYNKPELIFSMLSYIELSIINYDLKGKTKHDKWSSLKSYQSLSKSSTAGTFY